MVLAIAVAVVKLWIIENRWWSWFTGRNLAQDLGILFQKRIDHLRELACNPNHDSDFPTIRSLSLVIPTHPWDKAFVQLGPFAST